MKQKSYITHGIKTMVYLLATALLLTMTGCKELNQLAELEELERLMAQMQDDSLYNPPPINSMQELATQNDSIKTDIMTYAPLPPNTLQTTIRKVKLEEHEYWTITTMGDNMGGTGITHSESCWCKRMKLFNGIGLTKPSDQKNKTNPHKDN